MATTPQFKRSINSQQCHSGRALLQHLISAPSKFNRIGLPFKDNKAGAAEVDWIMVRGPALETGSLGRDNQKITTFKYLRHTHHIFMNYCG
jgi:hypothetical protein